MAYSTIKQVRANENILSLTESPDLTNDIVWARVVRADQYVQVDLSNVADFSFEDADTPIVINQLSNFKATELCLVWLYTRKRIGLDQDDIQYWRDLYDMLKQQALDGEVDLGVASDGTGTFSMTARQGVEPALGTGKWSEFQTLEDLQEERPTDS